MTDMLHLNSFDVSVYARGNADAEKLAIVIPGRLDTKDYIHNTSLVDALAGQGYYALSFDPPGTWHSPGDISIYTTTNYLKVIEEIIHYFDNRPTVLLGHSRGGSVAMLASGFDAVVAIVPIMASFGAPTPPGDDAMKVGYNEEFRDMPPGDKKSVDPKRFELPLTYFEDGQRYVPKDSLMNCHKPKFVIYGRADEFTEPQHVEETFKLAPGPKRLLAVDSEHDYRLHSKVVGKINQAIIEYLSLL